MARIKIPPFCISFILDFFIHRKNAVLTQDEISDSYEVQIGIDQGEVISPLLWCIYLDLLLCEIGHLNKGYQLTHNWMSDVSKGTSLSLQTQIATLGFMDDANWISHNLKDLEDILEVADDYYTLTRAAINKDKSKLLTNDAHGEDEIPIRFGQTVIPIIPNYDAVCFLGVKININLKHFLVKKELQMHIRNFINVIKTKPITD